MTGENDEAAFGPQVVASAEDEVLGFSPRLLLSAVTLSLESVVDGIHARQGLAIAAHVDRKSFGLMGQLGFIPDAFGLGRAGNFSPACRWRKARTEVRLGFFP